MRVAVVCPYDLGRIGGVQDQVRRLVRWLERAGHQAWMVGPGSAGPNGAAFVGGVTVIRANQSAAPISLDPRTIGSVRRALDDADCVHIHEPFVPTVSLAALLVNQAAKVATFHAAPSGSVRALYRGASPLLRRSLRRAGVVTAVSPVAAASVDRIASPRVIPNGIDLVDYQDRTAVPTSVVFVGRDDERKGLSVLLAAWSHVHEVVPDATLTVVGAANRERASAGVEYLGVVSEQRKRDILARSAIFCAPNLGGESFGITLVEAMASGCAVVASALPAFVHVLGNAATLVASGDPAALARALTAVMTDGARLDEYRHRGLQRASAFDGEHVAAAYIAAYEAAAAGHISGRS